MAYATERAKVLLGCYRQSEAADPDTYVAAIAVVLADYSEQIITEITHPKTGLPRKTSWLPTVKDVFDACEELADWDRKSFEYEMRRKAQLAERERLEPNRTLRPTYEQLKAKYGDWTAALPKKPENLQADARKQCATDQMKLQEYQAAGLEPRYTSDGTLLSLSLVRLLEGMG